MKKHSLGFLHSERGIFHLQTDQSYLKMQEIFLFFFLMFRHQGDISDTKTDTRNSLQDRKGEQLCAAKTNTF